MKFMIVLVALFAVVLAAEDATVLRYDNDNIGVDGFKFGFETSDGTKHESSGVLNNVGSEAEALAVKGSYSYVGDDGQTYSVSYVADENGFQPIGAHIPKADA
uniref:CSON006902 protein n=1 Tax=Culicoides sonorensis TaxID=179676 RepID=A0A336LZR1_CULSO